MHTVCSLKKRLIDKMTFSITIFTHFKSFYRHNRSGGKYEDVTIYLI